MDVLRLFNFTIVSISFLFIKGTIAASQCYNTYRSTTYDCEYGCCGDYYDYDYGCCTRAGTIAGAVIGVLVFIAIIAIIIYLCKRKANRGIVINPQPAQTVTVIAPPPYQPQGPVVAPPAYPGPPAGPGFHGPHQPQMYPPPPPHNGMYDNPAYPPTNQPGY